MNLIRINPFIRYAGLHSFYSPTRKNSVCYDCRLFYIAQGEGSLLANGQTYAISGNEAVFLPAETRYRFSFADTNAVRIYILNLDLTDTYSNYNKSFGTPTEDAFDPTRILKYDFPNELKRPIVLSNAFPVHRHIEKCIDLFLQKTPYYNEEISARAKLALLEILREQENGEYPLVQNIIEYIRENYYITELTNQTIAEHFHYHPYYLSRIMKTSTKKTLHGYLLDYRLHMAKNYLTTTTLNVTTIAEKTGFSSYTYFIKLFRERTGISPLQYRKTHKNIGF